MLPHAEDAATESTGQQCSCGHTQHDAASGGTRCAHSPGQLSSGHTSPCTGIHAVLLLRCQAAAHAQLPLARALDCPCCCRQAASRGRLPAPVAVLPQPKSACRARAAAWLAAPTHIPHHTPRSPAQRARAPAIPQPPTPPASQQHTPRHNAAAPLRHSLLMPATASSSARAVCGAHASAAAAAAHHGARTPAAAIHSSGKPPHPPQQWPLGSVRARNHMKAHRVFQLHKGGCVCVCVCARRVPPPRAAARRRKSECTRGDAARAAAAAPARCAPARRHAALPTCLLGQAPYGPRPERCRHGRCTTSALAWRPQPRLCSLGQQRHTRAAACRCCWRRCMRCCPTPRTTPTYSA
jgi:hypothetical protein